MSVNIDKFFRIWDFLKSTPYPDLKKILREKTVLYSDTKELYRKILTGTTVSTDGLGVVKDSVGDVLTTGFKQEHWGLNPAYNLSYPKDLTVIDTALQAREKTWNFFAKVLIPGSYAYNTIDMNLYRKMLVDWNAASRTFKDLFRHASNAFSLDDDDIDKAIRGFGIDFVNKNTLENIIQRDLFLLSMCELYKIKGSPDSITKSLQLAGVSKAVIREYWIEKNPYIYKTLQIRGKAVGKYKQYLDTINNQYVFNVDPELYSDAILSWDNFQSRLWDIAEPHWWYTNEDILAIEFNPETKIKLPSIMPYFGIEFYPNIERFNIFMAILENVMSNQINSILSGDKDLVPQEIGVSGYNEELNQRDLWISGYDKPLTLVECFLGFVYGQVRYDDWIVHNDLQEFMIEHGILNMPTFTYPWAVQELIYWAYQHKDDVVNGVYTIDSVMKMYTKNKSLYYCSTNELINWWIAKDPVNNYWNSIDDTNIPMIFFDTDYSFQYDPVRTDTTMDRILFYSGSRRLNFKSPPFEYFETLDDAQRLLATAGNRLPFDNGFTSTLPSNHTNNHTPLQFELQEEYRNTYFNYISEVPSDYVDRQIHDGSQITPRYVGKYPRSFKWNWGIDSNYLYFSLGTGNWVRTEIETYWVAGDEPVRPDSDALEGHNIIGYQIYDKSYVYKYVSTKTWVRYKVITDWDYCECPVTTDGHVTSSSDLAHETVKAKIDADIAVIYNSDKSNLDTTAFNITIDPLSNNPQIIQYDVRKLETFIATFNLVLDSNGYLKTDFAYYLQNSDLYHRVTDYKTSVTFWVKKEIETTWTSNGTAMFAGGYKYPNLDLTNRYDADRILSGVSVLTEDELIGLDGTTNGGEILVSRGSSGHPETWKYNDVSEQWEFNPVNRINDIKLGVNQGLIDWIDSSVNNNNESYDIYATKLLTAMSSYVKVSFQDPDFDIAGIYKDIKNSGLHRDLINFFKPKRARLLYFSIDMEFDDRLFNSIIVDDVTDKTKILQSIDDRVPRNDGIFISDNISMFQASYHEDDTTESLVIPQNTQYGKAVYYLAGFEDERFNGFYFLRPDLGTITHPCYINYHNVVLKYITNSEQLNGYWKEWILTFRKQSYDWCDAVYLNYDTDPTSGYWCTKNHSPTASSSSSGTTDVVPGKAIPVDDLQFSDVRDCDINRSVDLSIYDLGKTNHWNAKHTRPELTDTDKTYEMTSQHLRKWTPALCKDPLNFRRIFPKALSDWEAAGYPENIDGERISGWDADDRNAGQQEASYTFWKSNYPYSDDQLSIRDGVTPPIGFRTKDWTQLQSLSDYNNTNYINPYYGITSIQVTNPGSGYSSNTVIGIDDAHGKNGVLTPVIVGGEITDITITNPGHYLAIPTIYFHDLNHTGSGAQAVITLGELISTIPVWWIRDPILFKSGPVHHRPMYLALQNIIHDCYPCIDLSTCCDYYDVGCRHDGPTNPIVVVWTPVLSQTSSSSSSSSVDLLYGWGAGQYSDYSVKDLNYDEWNHHHRTRGYITDLDSIINPNVPVEDQMTVQQYWENEPTWAGSLTNPGDTYCTECDDPLFTPDISVFTIPESWKKCGVYHNLLKSSNFNNAILNTNWTPAPTLLTAGEYDFPVGYTDGDSLELVHVFHRPSGYHYWEIRNLVNASSSSGGASYTTLLRSVLKEKLHTLDDIINETSGQWHVSPNNFLNGHDVDCSEDRWTDDIVDPSEYIDKIKSEITQNVVPGYITSSQWIRFNIEPYASTSSSSSGITNPYDPNKYGYLGDLNFEITDDINKLGNLYICIHSDVGEKEYEWNVAHNFEYDWINTGDDWILPDSPKNFYNYYFSNNYLYLYVATSEHVGWVRMLISDFTNPSNREDYYTNSWKLDDPGYAYRNVSLFNTFISADETYVCGNMVPYNETYQGIRLYYSQIKCYCSVVDEVEIFVYTYYPDSFGPYIRIETVNPAANGRKEHRFISKEYEGFLPCDFSAIPTEPIEHFNLKNYVPFYLYEDEDQTIKATWQRADALYYDRALIDEEGWPNPNSQIPKIEVIPDNYDFGSSELWDDNFKAFTVRNIGEGLLVGSATFQSPMVNFSYPSSTIYSLAANNTKSVTLRFRPTVLGVQNQVLQFSGGGSHLATVSGTGIPLTKTSRVTEADELRLTEDDDDNRIVQ